MCKFHHHLFLMTIGLLFVMIASRSLNTATAKDSSENFSYLMDLLMPKDDYNLHYDQRQKGNENYRLHLDGFFIAMPHQGDSELLSLSDNLFENIGDEFLVFDKNKTPTYNLDLYKTKQDYANGGGKTDVTVVEIPSSRIDPDIQGRYNLKTASNYENSSSRPKKYLYRFLNFLKRTPAQHNRM